MAFAGNTTAVSTTSDAAVTLFTADRATNLVRIVNTGAVAGFFSLDGGANWLYLPATAASTNPVPVDIPLDNHGMISRAVLVKRIAGGSDLSNVFGYAF